MEPHRQKRDAEATTPDWATWRRAAAASLAGILVVAALAGLGHRQDVRHREALLLGEGRHVVALEREFLSRELRAVHSDLLFLAQQPALGRFFAGDAGTRSDLAREYLGFARSKPLYDQIRLLDGTGRELVRVNRRGDDVEVVDQEHLQSKAGRYYFREAIRLAEGEVFVSPLDLNVERGEIERPLKPVIRLATPVVDAFGNRRGLLVLNYAGARLLGKLREIAVSSPGEMMLVDSKGEYLQAPDPSREWGWLLDHSARFRDDHPAAWERIRSEPVTQVQVGDDLFTAEWIPLAAGAAAAASAVAIVSRIPMVEARALLLDRERWLLLAGAPAAIVALGLYWGRSTVARRAQERRIAESEERLRILSSRLLAAQEEERRSLSRTLHDELGQQVTAIALDLKAALRDVDMREPTLRRAVSETEAVLSKLHEIATRVRPSVLDDLGLEDAIESYISEYQERTGVSVVTELKLPPRGVPGAIAENVYRILQEALANVSAHAGTDAARVRLVASRNALELSIEDEGRGFDAAAPARSGRLGILGMRERVELLEGEFELDTGPGQGTRIHVRLPLAAG